MTRAPVLGRHKDHDHYLSGMVDFTLGPVEPYEVPLPTIAADPRVSLYCLDLPTRTALFVETPDDLDLTSFPFLYVAQFKEATHVITLSFDELHALASATPRMDAAPVFVHSVGRCGSTLVSKAFKAVPEVCSLSEPDVFSQLTGWLGNGELSEDEILGLVDSCVRVACKPVAGAETCRFWAIKFRAECIELADLLLRAFPHARQIYLTREPLGWLESAYRAFADPEWVEDLEQRLFMEDNFKRMHPLIRDFCRKGHPMPIWKIWMLVWISNTETFQRLRESGMQFCIADFKDLNATPRETMRRIFDYCAIPVGDWGAIDDCLARDAQAGSRLARSEINVPRRRLPLADKSEAEKLLLSRGHLTA